MTSTVGKFLRTKQGLYEPRIILKFPKFRTDSTWSATTRHAPRGSRKSSSASLYYDSFWIGDQWPLVFPLPQLTTTLSERTVHCWSGPVVAKLASAAVAHTPCWHFRRFCVLHVKEQELACTIFHCLCLVTSRWKVKQTQALICLW